jgi:hypothetical protein
VLASEHGLAFEQKGRGVVLGNTEGYATLSSLNLAMSANGMVRRRVNPNEILRPTPPQRHWWDVDAVDLTRAFMAWGIKTKEDLKQVINDKRAEREMKAAARKTDGFLSALAIPALPRMKPYARTALSTPRDGLGRPAKPLSRPSRQKPTKDYLDALIAAQTKHEITQLRRRLIARRRKTLMQSEEPDLPHHNL